MEDFMQFPIIPLQVTERVGSNRTVEICRHSPSTGGVSSNHCWLVEGSRQKKYRPLLERPCCESLESRINHFVKRGRLEREEGENGEGTLKRGKRPKHCHNSSTHAEITKQAEDQKAED